MSLQDKLGQVATNVLERKADRVIASSQAGVIWSRTKGWLNGKKTAIGVLVLFAPQIVDGLREILVAFGLDLLVVVKWTGAILTTIGVAHKVIKGLQGAGVLEADAAPDDRRGMERRAEDKTVTAAVIASPPATLGAPVSVVPGPGGTVSVTYTDQVTGETIPESQMLAKLQAAEAARKRGGA